MNFNHLAAIASIVLERFQISKFTEEEENDIKKNRNTRKFWS
jgi:hypothetical protein